MSENERMENQPEVEVQENPAPEIPGTPETPEISEAPEKPAKPSMKKRVLKEIREWVVALAVALLVVFVLKTFLFTVIKVDGASMNPTLKNKERLFVTVYDVKFGETERGDIVICNYPGRYTEYPLGIKTKTYFVKRVVAVPGDTVSRVSNVTYVTYTETGETVALDEAFANRYQGDDYEYTLGEDEYFVVGDNRGNSHDSRDWHDSDPSRDVGPITGDMLVGHVRNVFWPIPDFRSVK